VLDRRRPDAQAVKIIMTNPTPEMQAWHKQVGMLCNNRAWALAEQVRSSLEDSEMLTAAHTSSYHWNLVGTELNRMRAMALLAQVHALLGHGDTAMSLATQMRSYFLGRSDTPAWELAFTHAIYAHSARVAGEPQIHAAAYREAVAAGAAIADDEERQIFDKTFTLIPAPT
jgi:hypothetical protein